MTSQELKDLAEVVAWAEERARLLGRKEARIIVGQGTVAESVVAELADEAMLAHNLPLQLALIFEECLWLEVGRIMELKEAQG